MPPAWARTAKKQAHLGFDLGVAELCNPPPARVGSRNSSDRRRLPTSAKWSRRWAICAEAHSRSQQRRSRSRIGAAAPAQRAEDAARRDALGPQDPRSDLDHRLHRPQPRLHGLRHAVRHRREGRDQAADGRQVRGVGRQAHLHLHPARRPALARRPARHGGGLRRLHQALGRQGLHRPEADDLRRRPRGQGRQDLRHEAQGADRPRAARARQAVAPTCPS